MSESIHGIAMSEIISLVFAYTNILDPAKRQEILELAERNAIANE